MSDAMSVPADFAALVARAVREHGWVPGVYTHRKSAVTYRATECYLNEADCAVYVSYRRAGEPAWGRPIAQFMDGRFTYRGPLE